MLSIKSKHQPVLSQTNSQQKRAKTPAPARREGILRAGRRVATSAKAFLALRNMFCVCVSCVCVFFFWVGGGGKISSYISSIKLQWWGERCDKWSWVLPEKVKAYFSFLVLATESVGEPTKANKVKNWWHLFGIWQRFQKDQFDIWLAALKFDPKKAAWIG